MRFIKNEHRAGAVLIQPIPQWRRILLVAQEGVRNDKLRMGGPGIDRVTAFTIRFTFWRIIISRRISPASIVFPRPTSSAMKRLTRGICRAFLRGSNWYDMI